MCVKKHLLSCFQILLCFITKLQIIAISGVESAFQFGCECSTDFSFNCTLSRVVSFFAVTRKVWRLMCVVRQCSSWNLSIFFKLKRNACMSSKNIFPSSRGLADDWTWWSLFLSFISFSGWVSQRLHTHRSSVIFIHKSNPFKIVTADVFSWQIYFSTDFNVWTNYSQMTGFIRQFWSSVSHESNLQKPAASSSLCVPVQKRHFILWNNMLILLEMRCVHVCVCLHANTTTCMSLKKVCWLTCHL